MQLAVMASGSGTLLEAFLEADLPVGLVVVDRPCRAERVAATAGVLCEPVMRTDFGRGFDRADYTSSIVNLLHQHDPRLVAMAGFGTILGAEAFTAFPHRIVNTHPALLPSFPGWHAVENALAYGVKVTGCTVHFATEEVDAGPIIAQEAVTVAEDDTVESLHERIKSVERRLYVAALRRLLDGPPAPR